MRAPPGRTPNDDEHPLLVDLRKRWAFLRLAAFPGWVSLYAMTAPDKWRRVGGGATLQDAIASALQACRGREDKAKAMTSPAYCDRCGDDVGRMPNGTPRNCARCLRESDATRRNLATTHNHRTRRSSRAKGGPQAARRTKMMTTDQSGDPLVEEECERIVRDRKDSREDPE